MGSLRIGFVPNSDSELLAGIPICREFRKRGHHSFISLNPHQPLYRLQKQILKLEKEESIPLEVLKGISLDVRLFNSKELQKNNNNAVFGFNVVAGLTAHEREKIRNIYIYSGSNFAISPSRIGSIFKNIYKEPIPVIGMPSADIYNKGKMINNNNKTIIYPDGCPFHYSNRKEFFGFLVRLAQENPSHEFIIKERYSSEEAIVHFPFFSYRKFAAQIRPPNLKITGSEQSTHHLSEQAMSLIGIHSGAFWEAMINGIDVILLSDPPQERVNGVVFSRNELISKEGLRVKCKEVDGYLKSPRRIPAHIVKKEVPYFDASRRIVDVIECIFDTFSGDDRLPFMKFDFEYGEDFSKEIEKYRVIYKGLTGEQLSFRFHTNHMYYNSLSNLVDLITVVNPDLEDEDTADFLRTVEYYSDVTELSTKCKNLEEVSQYILKKKHECFDSCIETFYKPENNHTIFDEFHIIENGFLKYGYYVYDKLLRDGKKREAAEYYELLMQKFKSNGRAVSLKNSKNCFIELAFDGYIEVQNYRASILEDAGKHCEAVEVLRSLFNETNLSYDQFVILINRITSMFENQNEHHQAIDFLLGLAGDFSKGEDRRFAALNRSLRIFEESENHRGLCRILQSYINDSISDVDKKMLLLFRLADILKGKKDYFSAMNILKSLENCNDLKINDRFRTQHRIAIILEKMGKYQESKDLLNMLVKKLLIGVNVEDSYYYGIRFHLGKVHYHLKEFAESRLQLEKCLSVRPDHREARNLLSQIPI